MPGFTMGQTVGVDINPQNHLFSTPAPTRRIARRRHRRDALGVHATGKFVKEWGTVQLRGVVCALGARTSMTTSGRWTKGRGCLMHNPQAVLVAQQFGRTPEAIDYLESAVEKQGRGYETRSVVRNGTSRSCSAFIRKVRSAPSTGRPTSSPGTHDNLFCDGYGNSRREDCARRSLAEAGGHLGHRFQPVQHRPQRGCRCER